MINLLFAAALASPVQDPGPVELFREFKKGELLTYQVKSHLLTQTKQLGAPIYMPNEMDMNYDFTIEIKDMKTEGFASLIYKRPTMTIITDVGGDIGLQTQVEKVNLNMGMVLSPVNEMTEVKDLNPPEKPAPKTGGGTLLNRRLASMGFGAQLRIPYLNEFVQDVYRLALCTGSLDAALDLAPKLPYEEVEKGDTWKRTVSYQPQKLKGADGKTVVQRLDYTYVYDGVVTKDNAKYHQITATLKLDTDVATFIHDTFNVTSGVTGIKSIPLKLDSKIVYYLDEKTKNTVSASAESSGNWTVLVNQVETPVMDEKLNGRTTLKLLSKK